MTSETGDFCPGSMSQFRQPLRNLGFSMVEVVMVVGIVVLLMSLVFVAAGGSRNDANRRATQAQMTRIIGALEDYKRLKGRYPPDGYDFEVKNAEGELLRGSACLHYFLTKEVQVRRKVSGKVRTRLVDPLLEVKESIELSNPEDGYAEGVYEICDPWRTPFWYDNTEDGKFEPLDEPGHPEASGVDSFPPDPRTDESLNSVDETGIQGKGYDLWSYAEGRYKEKENLSSVIASWNLGDKDPRRKKKQSDEEE